MMRFTSYKHEVLVVSFCDVRSRACVHASIRQQQLFLDHLAKYDKTYVHVVKFGPV